MSNPIGIINGSANSSSNSATDAANATANSGTTLTQQDFLQIMVAQFTQQDPLSSGDSGGSSGTSDYVNELMSMTNLTTMQTMSAEQLDQVAATLPGSSVALNNNGVEVDGTVQNTLISQGSLYVTVGGKQYPITDLMAVTQSQAQAAAAAAAAAAGAASNPNSGS